MRVLARAVPLSVLALVLAAVLPPRRASGLTIDELGFTESTCAAIRANPSSLGYIPCECQLNTGNVQPFRCSPNCCPRSDTFEGHRCHYENRLTWSVYEQDVCVERPPAEYTDDTPDCFYKGNDPEIVAVTVQPSTLTTHLSFRLSIVPEHTCHNLYVSRCMENRSTSLLRSFRLNNTADPIGYCWLDCAPAPLEPCTATSCTYNRGETHANIKEWTIGAALPPGDYALVCRTLRQHDAVGSTLFQDQFSQTFFNVPTWVPV